MKIKLVIPESLSEVTLVQYMEFLKVAKDLDLEQLKEETIRHFCGVPLEFIRGMKSKDVNEIYGAINLMFQDEKKLISEFKLSVYDFGFIPSLDDISHGEYVDLDKYIGDWEQMHRAMAVLFRPIIKRDKTKYSIMQYEGTDDMAELMKLMPLDVVLGAQVFFYDLGNELLKAIPHFLEKKGREVILMSKANSTSNGDGITQSINSLKEMCNNLSQSLDFLSDKRSLI